MMREVLSEKELNKLFDSYTIVMMVKLLNKGEILSLPKVRILNYIRDHKDTSISQISKDLKIDYKTTHRIIKTLAKHKIIVFDKPTSQGKTSKVKPH